VDVLEVIQRFCNAVGGISAPSTAVANQDEGIIQIVELLNQEGRSLAKRHNWQALRYEATFTTVATESQGTLTSIIGATQVLEKVVNETIWNRTTKTPIYGPLADRSWQGQKARVSIGPWPEYQIRGNELRFNPVPAAGDTCYFAYTSKCWCTTVNGANFQRNVVADTDLFLLDDEIILAGLEWRWLRKKGLSYAEEFASYEALVRTAIGNDGTKRTLDASGYCDERRPHIYVPEGSWPL